MTRSALQNKHIRPNTASWVVTMQHYFWFINWRNLKCKKNTFSTIYSYKSIYFGKQIFCYQHYLFGAACFSWGNLQAVYATRDV